ncbi:leucine-rich repeat-containing protein [Tetraselmis virus 1]|uniref:Leucine-rich repeat-containing protein n=1 Tax=Tetraselmis virus 1 TaxID=2060617 RepID=A0A2P0VMW2_9VIRU|nr:leucine-rich repeat-containing protein [Tetraselmis virus 1]AUF82220.1 leucine-rich repeat-containing protein [Tetraselmis virus 1]
MNDDCLYQILRSCPIKKLLAYRLINKQWKRCAESVIDKGSIEFVSSARNGDLGSEVDVFELSGDDNFDPILTLKKSVCEVEEHLKKSICKLYDYRLFNTENKLLNTRIPVKLTCQGMLSLHQSKYLSGLYTLKEIDLTGIKICDVPKRSRHVLSVSLSKLPNLEILKAPYYNLSEDDTSWFKNLKLKELDLFQNNVGYKGAKHISGITTLTKLDAGNNDTGKRGIQSLGNLVNLTDLSISFNQGDDESLSICLSKLENLKSFKSSWNDVGPHTGLAVSKLQNLDTIELSFTDSFYVVPFIKNMTQITSLDLSYGGISDDGLQYLENLPVLEVFNMTNNDITDSGIIRFCRSVSATNIKEMDMGWNRIGYNGALAVSNSMKKLESLDMQKNEILDVGLHSILEKLDNLTYLDVSGNGLSDSILRHMKIQLQKSRPELEFNIR